MKILFLSQWFPFPPDNGAKIRIYHLLKGLSRFHDVTLISFYDPTKLSPAQPARYPFCSQVQVVPWKPFDAKSRKGIIGYFSLSPRSLLDTHSVEMEMMISNAVSTQRFDLIIASQLTMASYYPIFGGVPAIFEEIELGLFIDQAFKGRNWIRRLRFRLTWFKLQQYFLRLINSYAACTVVSDQEHHLFAQNFPRHGNKVKVLPNCIAADDYKGLHVDVNPHNIIFSGSFTFKPNYHAMQWFVREVFPLILKKVPDANLIITGDHANLPLPDMRNITLSGYVDDIKSLIASCNVSIAPIWSGGGTRLKILEAMAIGTPVVATSKGAEGLLVQDGKQILIADQPEKFAEHVIKILTDKELRDSLSANALQLIEENYDWKTIMPNFLRLLEMVVSV